MGGTPKPSLVKSTALSKAQAVFARINSLLPNYSTPISPVTVYTPLPEALTTLPNTGSVVGNALLAAPSGYTNATTSALWGVWVAPDINNGADYQVQVETFAAGAGGGGGTTVTGGGGGAGGEYAAEPVYTVTPGLSYIWIRGIGGPGGTAQPVSGGNQSVQGGDGTPGGDTIFDLASTGLPGGVHAHGGQPGDIGGTGIGGAGGTGSANTLHSSGGQGATTTSGIASDNPEVFQTSESYWTNPQPPNGPPTPETWLIMDDASFNQTGGLNNSEQDGVLANVTQFTGGLKAVTNPPAPVQAPTSTGAGGFGNNTQYGGCMQFSIGKLSSPSARITLAGPTAENYFTMSAWLQCDASGVWGNPANTYATVATDCAYTNSVSAGVALYFDNSNLSGSPSWKLIFRVANGSVAYSASIPAASIPPVPGTWYYVTATYTITGSNTGTVSIFLNGTLVNSVNTTFGNLPGGYYGMTLGMRAAGDANLGWYFGYMSNFWFAPGVANSTLMSTAYGANGTATGGSGGGSSGGPYLANASMQPLNTQYTSGNPGTSAAASLGGAGGTVPTQSAYVSSITLDGEAGGAGSNANTSNNTTTNPAAGGGGAGSSTSPLTVGTITAMITAAATFNGVDGTQAGVLYNPTQQGTQATLVAGGQSSDPTTGSKNSILILPPGLMAELSGKTIVDVYLTVYNANPSNTISPVLEINYSTDSVIPSNYQASEAYLNGVTQLAPYVLQPGNAAQVISLNNTGFKSALKFAAPNTATAIVLGPGGTAASSPSFDAYNAPASNYFYTSIYGPGSTDSFGNSLEPVLTILYTNGTPQLGQTGGGGIVAVTVINNEATPIATIEPFATVDPDGNQLGAGFTGPIQNWSPLSLIAGEYEPEAWQTVTFSGGFPAGSGYIRVKRLAESNFCMLECELTFTALAASVTSLSIGSFPSAAYYPLTGRQCVGTIGGTSTDATVLPRIFINTSGALQLFIPKGATALSVNFMYATD